MGFDVISFLSGILEVILFFFYSISDTMLLSLILLSIAVKFITYPLEKWGSKVVAVEDAITKVLAPQIKEIKRSYTGGNRHDALLRLYKRYSYNPIYSIRSLTGLLVQLPIFIAAYHMINSLPIIDGMQAWFIKDLSQSDHLLVGFNLLPILMFVISICSVIVTPNFSVKNQVQTIFVALCFFILLYNSPSALVIYWIMNNVNSLVLNIWKKYNVSKYLIVKNGFKIITQEWIVFSVLSSFILFYIVPLFMISVAPEEYDFLLPQEACSYGFLFFLEFAKYFVFTLFIIQLASTVLIILKNKTKSHMLEIVKRVFLKTTVYTRISCYFIFFWIIISGLFFPLIISKGGMQELDKLGVNYLHLIYALLIVIPSSLLAILKYKHIVLTFYTLLLLTTVIVSIDKVYESNILSGKIWIKKANTGNTKNAKGKLQSKTSLAIEKFKDESALSRNELNIVVVSFDGMSRAVIDRILNKNANLKSIFKDFTFYSNVVSQSPSTRESIIGELYGDHDYKSIGSNFTEFLNALSGNYKDEFLSRCFHFTPPYNSIGNKPPSGYFTNKDLGQSASLCLSMNFDFLSYPIFRVFSTKLSIRSLKRKLKAVIPFSHIPTYAQKYPITLFNYRSYISQLSVKDKGLTVHRGHYDFSHHPVLFDKNGNFLGGDINWYDANQNFNGINNLAKLCINEMQRLILKLKELGIYDNTLIIFKSDHGVHVAYTDPDQIDSTKINNHNSWGYDRYRPYLMIKNEHTIQDKMSYIERVVSLNDLARTILLSAGYSIDECENFKGIDLLGREPIVDNGYRLYVVPDEHASYRFEDHIEVIVNSRQTKLYEALKNDPKVKLSK